MAPKLDSYFRKVDELAEPFIERLRKAVAIPSVSADEERRPDVVKVTQMQNGVSSSNLADLLLDG
jgi:Cys-Gly metallodipeptidase DUG1